MSSLSVDTRDPKSWGILAGQDIDTIRNAPHGAWRTAMLSKKKLIKYIVNRYRSLNIAKSDKVCVSAFNEADAKKLAEPLFGPMPDFTPDEILEAKSKVKDVITVWKTSS